MTYCIRQKGDRWLIYACGACILECADERMARETMEAASALLQRPAPSQDAAFTFRSQKSPAPEATRVAARYG